MQILFILYDRVAGQVPFQLHVDSFFPITRIYFVYYFDFFNVPIFQQPSCLSCKKVISQCESNLSIMCEQRKEVVRFSK